MTENAGVKAMEAILTGKHRGAVAFDPGGTTGIAYTFRDDFAVRTDHVSMEFTVEWLKSLLFMEGRDIDVVVVEQHIPKPGMSMGREARLTMELVGSIEAVAKDYGKEVVRHNSSQMKTVPWVKWGRGSHERDAGKHLARFLLDDSGERGLIKTNSKRF